MRHQPPPLDMAGGRKRARGGRGRGSRGRGSKHGGRGRGGRVRPGGQPGPTQAGAADPHTKGKKRPGPGPVPPRSRFSPASSAGASPGPPHGSPHRGGRGGRALTASKRGTWTRSLPGTSLWMRTPTQNFPNAGAVGTSWRLACGNRMDVCHGDAHWRRRQEQGMQPTAGGRR